MHDTGSPILALWKRKILVIPCVLIAVGAAMFGLCEREKRVIYRVPVLMYHKIGDGGNSAWWVTVADFESQLGNLQEQGYRSILPSDLVAHQRWGKPLPSKPVIITFDDGYLNCMEQAEPLLKKYGFRAVCYLITGQISETPDTRRSYEGATMLSWVDVRAMQRRGTIAFGGHTRSHANLRAMKDPYAEIRACYEDIRRTGGFKPAGFCYPYGQYNEQTPSAVAKAGFITAVTCVDGAVETGPDLKLLELPRVSIMGGIHRYHAEHVAASQPGSLAVRVWKEGRPMELRPRLVWSGHASRPDEGWLPRVSIADQPVMLTWTLPVPELSGAPVLELWDNLRVMKMFQTPLKP